MYLSTEQLAVPVVPPVSPSRTFFRAESLLEKGSGALNEDVLLTAGDTFGVFDGATSLDKRRFDGGLSGGLIAAKTAAQVFRQKDSSLDQLAEQANGNIRRAFLGQNLSMENRHLLWSTSMAVIRLSGEQLEYCQIGDAPIVLVMRDGSYQLITSDVDIDRETLMLWQETRGLDKEARQELMGTQIRRVREEMNRNYGVLNGEPVATSFLRHGHLNLTGVRDILLFTDGLYIPREDPQLDNDWQTLIDLYFQGGLQAVRDRVRGLQKNDPELIQYPRFKQHDDMAAVAISLGHTF